MDRIKLRDEFVKWFNQILINADNDFINASVLLIFVIADLTHGDTEGAAVWGSSLGPAFEEGLNAWKAAFEDLT